MNAAPMRIAVIGAGTAGAASASLLARAGHHVDLYERAQDPGAVGAGILLQPTGMYVLDKLGVLDEIVSHGAKVDRLYGTTASNRTVLDIRYQRFRPSAFGLGLHRGALFSVLWRVAGESGVQRHCGHTALGVEQDANGVSIQWQDRPATRHDAVVVANGTHSAVRSNLGIAHRVQPYPWGALWCMVPDGATPLLELRQWYRGAYQMLGLMPTGHAYGKSDKPLLSIFWSIPTDALQSVRERGLEALKRDILALAPIQATLDQITSMDQWTFASYADVQMPFWHRGRVVCLGDCAHATSPQLGQGANLALLDAWTLSTALKRHATADAAFAAYSRLRRDHVHFYQQASRWLTPFFQSNSRLGASLRDAFMGISCRLPILETMMVSTLCGVRTGWSFGKLDLE